MARAKRTKKTAAADAQVEPGPSRDALPNLGGRLASDIDRRPVSWLWEPWIPRGTLSMIVGPPGSGKSSLGAFLLSRTKHSCVLPGYEESVEQGLLPRLAANGVPPRSVRVLDDRPYRLPSHEQQLTTIIQRWEAEVLLIDPVDSYMGDDLSENDGKVVRAYLESLARIAAATGTAVVSIRHPGKDRANVCPGSRSWRAVPRRILLLDDDGGEDPTRIMRVYKTGVAVAPRPIRYRLEEQDNGAPEWLPGELVDQDAARLAAAVEGPGDRSRLQEACQLIYHLFCQSENPSVQSLVTQCQALGIGVHSRDEAKRLLGVTSRPSTAGGEWIMRRTTQEWPKWLDQSVS